MKKLWAAVGIAGFWLLSPLLLSYLRLNARTRIIVEHRDKLLLVKPWLGTGQWDFPGGGLHLSETPLNGVIRETLEETGLEIDKSQVQSLGLVKGKGLLPPSVHCFYAGLKQEPKVKKRFVEIIDIVWADKSDIDKYPLSAPGKICFDLWKNRP